MKLLPVEQLTFESFAPLLHTRFRVWVDEREIVELELVQATPPQLSPTRTGQRPVSETFSLLFVGPAERVLPQRIYRFESERLGQFELFIVPVGRDAAGTQYEATFNRLVKERTA